MKLKTGLKALMAAGLLAVTAGTAYADCHRMASHCFATKLT